LDPENEEDIIKRRGKPGKGRLNVLLLLLLKILKHKEEKRNVPAVETSTPIDEKGYEQRDDRLLGEEETVVSSSPKIFPEEKEEVQGEGAQIGETVLPGKNLLKYPDKDPEKGELTGIKQRLGILEAKVTILDGILISLREQLAHSGETQPESETKIKLQAFLSNTDQKPEER
jgi:hypothetical protein